ncbi:MAG: hypothetical protein MUE54_06370 [Anaerolineae bacterium]|nr:hypothetical protein [Anaerolineae bacterium]
MTMLEEVVSLALQLNPAERLQLIKQVSSSIQNNPEDVQPTASHWGENLLRLLDEIGEIELDYPEIEDPVEWVEAQRQKEADRLKSYWDVKSDD